MSIPTHISQYIQDSVSSNISQEERVARIRIITELVHDKIVRLFAASDITVDDLLANQKTIRDGFVTTSRSDDETLVLYQRDSDLYTEDTEEVNELNDVILHLFFSNPNVTTEEYANLVNNFGLRKTTSEDGSIITYILETNLGTVSGNVNTDIVVARQTSEGIENKLNIGQLVYTTGDYEYDPNNASRILDTETTSDCGKNPCKSSYIHCKLLLEFSSSSCSANQVINLSFGKSALLILFCSANIDELTSLIESVSPS